MKAARAFTRTVLRTSRAPGQAVSRWRAFFRRQAKASQTIGWEHVEGPRPAGPRYHGRRWRSSGVCPDHAAARRGTGHLQHGSTSTIGSSTALKQPRRPKIARHFGSASRKLYRANGVACSVPLEGRSGRTGGVASGGRDLGNRRAAAAGPRPVSLCCSLFCRLTRRRTRGRGNTGPLPRAGASIPPARAANPEFPRPGQDASSSASGDQLRVSTDACGPLPPPFRGPVFVNAVDPRTFPVGGNLGCGARMKC